MKTTPVSFIVAAMLVPALCLAESGQPDMESPQNPQKREKGGPDRPERAFFELWKVADTDNDGYISKAEFGLMPRVQKLPEEKRETLFARLDKDQDGRLGRGELVRFGKPREGEPEPPMKRLWELDSDRSGGISFEELQAGPLFMKLPPQKQQAVFDRLDTDGDGVITPNDRPEPPFKRPDGKTRPHRPGAPSPGKGGAPEQVIRKLDVNGDGSISFEEFRAGPAVKDLDEDEQEDRFERLDTNGDQKLSPEDMPPAPPAE
jgi:Ca2+-binding EF-hand superfamily protein